MVASLSPKELKERWCQELVNFLLTCKGGMDHRTLQNQVVNQMGKPVPLTEMGFSTWEEFLIACQHSIYVGVPKANPSNGKKFIFLNPNALHPDAAHIYKFTREQEKAKGKKAYDGTPREPSMHQVIMKDARILFQGRPSYQQPFVPTAAPGFRNRGSSRLPPRFNKSSSASRSFGPVRKPYPLMGNTMPQRSMANGYGGISSGSQDIRGNTASNKFTSSAISNAKYSNNQPSTAFFMPSGLEEDDDDFVGDDDDFGFDMSSGGPNFVVKPVKEDEWVTVSAVKEKVEPKEKENMQPRSQITNFDCVDSWKKVAGNETVGNQSKATIHNTTTNLSSCNPQEDEKVQQPLRKMLNSFDWDNWKKVSVKTEMDTEGNRLKTITHETMTKLPSSNPQEDKKVQQQPPSQIVDSFECQDSWKKVIVGTENETERHQSKSTTGSEPISSSGTTQPPAYSMGPCPKITPSPGQMWHIVAIGEHGSAEDRFSIVRRLVEHVKIRPLEEAMAKCYGSEDGKSYVVEEHPIRGYYAIYWTKERKWVRGQLFEDPKPTSKIICAFAVDYGVFVKVDFSKGNLRYLKKEFTKIPHSAYFAKLIDETGTEISREEASKSGGIVCTVYGTETHELTETVILYGLH